MCGAKPQQGLVEEWPERFARHRGSVPDAVRDQVNLPTTTRQDAAFGGAGLVRVGGKPRRPPLNCYGPELQEAPGKLWMVALDDGDRLLIKCRYWDKASLGKLGGKGVRSHYEHLRSLGELPLEHAYRGLG